MKDNIYILIFYSVVAILALITFFLVMYIRNQNLLWQQRKQFQESEILQQKELLSAVIESQETERKRIGEDLHDEIGATLSAIKLMLGTLKQPTDETKDVIIPAKQLIDQMIKDVRNIAHDLSPPGLAMFGLYHSLESFVSLINSTGEIEINIGHDQQVEERILSEKSELALYRVITQLIANTLKHAGANLIEIDFKSTPSQIEITYTDNGKGFDVAILNERRGIGMQNIISRIQMINGTYLLETAPNQGFKLNMSCPIVS